MTLYSEIKKLYSEGFSERQIAKKLAVSRNTVSRYIRMDAAEMTTWLASTKHRRMALDDHHDTIVGWLKEHPDMSAAQVCDWLEERNFGQYAESTVRRYVKELRQKYKITKLTKQRQYEAVPQLPMGLQAQLDFGQTVQETTVAGKRIKLYCFACVLSHSRYKYVEWQSWPFRTEDLIRCLRHTFEYFGGKHKEIVFDQDAIMVVSENSGDLILTEGFQAFHEVEHFKLYACRGADPESKGKVENVVQFVKKNFANNRVFKDLDGWNQECLAWLDRRGNGKQHNLTKQIPSHVFEEEQKTLVPYTTYQTAENPSGERRQVRKDNTVMYRANRYSVPLGTYQPQGIEVLIRVNNGKLFIVIPETGELIATHTLGSGQGELIKASNHGRNRDQGIPTLLKQVAKRFKDTMTATDYLEQLHQRYPRYIRDQLKLVNELFATYPQRLMDQALTYCVEQSEYSATEFKDMVVFLRDYESATAEEISVPLDVSLSNETADKLSGIKTQKRSLQDYADLMGGEANDAD